MILGYNEELKRYGALDFDLWVKGKAGLHCGQSMEIFINGEWIKDKIEMKADGTWYFANHAELFGTGDYRDSIEGIKIRFE
ncbi:DUF5348 domain-containing protein [Clostridium beijerinckii]|uniref:Formylmethanofuran dehydrogenase subunit C n=1 Tax=Clostridium beijerinckii TaxID=1520 RepID=A0AAE5LRV9_CLOBE|nr:DUF5348 domain-containing protein [Clostridium beijerinckii]NOW85323.1 formylmethanofuran dehydrogenase subunit C [Clostridium beijerinckii]NSB16470.1 formylmethanofuran dehydrogenase subunit C [Clostridium beijerinckii]OOM25675.1 hypothetical protein CLOBE_34700 [Clostridium beijerinckii]